MLIKTLIVGDGPAQFSPSAPDSGQPNVNYFCYELTSRFLSAKLEDGLRDGYWEEWGRALKQIRGDYLVNW